MTAIQKWLAGFAAAALACVIAYQWIDRPLSLFADGRLIRHRTYSDLTHIPDPFMPAAVIAFVLIGLCVLSVAARRMRKIEVTALLCSISAIVADATKSLLKFAFGRTWPDTWIENNPSFIHDGVYGFNFFHGGRGYMSFPSGHMALTSAVLTVLWLAYPKFRALYALVALAVAVGLIGANYHFLSDIVAGSFVGISTGWMVTAMWQARQR
jgi:membrane-associated phospholipid phosphatase